MSLKTTPTRPRRWYRGDAVNGRLIRRFVRDVVDQFHPDQIVLFGSFAYGKPHADSDVDVLVVMSTRNELDQAALIGLAVDPPFDLDIIVRTPKTLSGRLRDG